MRAEEYIYLCLLGYALKTLTLYQQTNKVITWGEQV